jgi:hypothetical protein
VYGWVVTGNADVPGGVLIGPRVADFIAAIAAVLDTIIEVLADLPIGYAPSVAVAAARAKAPAHRRPPRDVR